MTIVTINYADQDVEVIAGADAWTTSISTNRRFNGQRYNATRANQDEIRWNRYFPKSGTYRVKVVHLTDAASGITKLGINGVNGTKNTTNILNDDDWYSGSQIQNVESFATVEIARGFNYINHLTNSKNGSSSNYYIYYEFVEFTLINEHPVLGEATASPRNGMELLASVELGAEADELSSGTITAKKYLMVEYYVKKTGTANTRWRFNNDIGSNYSARQSGNGASDGSPLINQTSIYTHADTSGNAFGNIFIVNSSANEKLGIFHEVSDNVNRREVVAKWSNTSSQITEIDLLNTDTGGFSAGTTLKVWGMD